MPEVLQIHPDDNVLVALEDIPEGTRIHHHGKELVTAMRIPAKHKVSLVALGKGDPVYMYGVLVGEATEAIPKGGQLTIGNTRHAAQTYSGKAGSYHWDAPEASRWKERTFLGYHRSDGRVGTANYWLIIPLVFCENRNVDVIREALLEDLGYPQARSFAVQTHRLVEKYQAGADRESLLATEIIQTAEDISAQRVFPNVDGIRFLNHEGGCGGTREDSQTLVNLLAGYIDHPNVAGATILSLGCQNAQVTLMQEALQRRNPASDKPLVILEQQKIASERELIAEAVKRTFAGLIEANQTGRKPAGLEHLCVGLECGGSDGFSGLSANPALGHASDLIAALGGKTILSEFPELNGVEQELLNRCVDEDTASRFRDIMQRYAARAEAVGSGFAYNPSPGNIRDGLITDAIKSAGAARKGGTAPVSDVLDYTEPATKPGLSLLCTPGNDVESTTGLAGSGANIIVFTTGLGTPTGNPVAPTIKVASNTSLAQRMPDIIDIDAGTIISGMDTIASKGEEILEYIIDVASGKTIPRAVRLEQHDFIPWKRGISL